jgi:hypothetical protein
MAFLNKPIEMDDEDDVLGISGTMYQHAWYYPHCTYVTIFVEANSVKKDIFVEWIKAHKDIRAKESIADPLRDIDSSIKRDLVHVMFDLHEFYKLIGWTMWHEKFEYIDRMDQVNPDVRRVIDQNSNLFMADVTIIGYSTHRSFKNADMFLVQKKLDINNEWCMNRNQLSEYDFKD